jgi:hypothetical protein
VNWFASYFLGNSSNWVNLIPATPSGNYTLTIPTLSGNDTLSTLKTAQTFTGIKTFSNANTAASLSYVQGAATWAGNGGAGNQGMYQFLDTTSNLEAIQCLLNASARGCILQPYGGPLYVNGPLVLGATKFTTSGCSVSATTGSGTGGKLTLGANSCSVVITLNGATGMTAPNGWTCWHNDRTNPAANASIYESSDTASTATLSIPSTAGTTDVIDFGCSPY